MHGREIDLLDSLEEQAIPLYAVTFSERASLLTGGCDLLSERSQMNKNPLRARGSCRVLRNPWYIANQPANCEREGQL